AVAERLVPGLATAAQGIVLARGSLAPGGADQLDPAGDVVRAVPRHEDSRQPILVAPLDAGDRVAEGAGGAHAHDRSHLLRRGAVRVDPRLPLQPPHRTQVFGAEAGVGTDAAVVVD